MKVGVSEYEENWSPINHVSQPVPLSNYAPDEDDDDEEGISDTMGGDKKRLNDDGESTMVDDVLEEGEIREEEEDDFVVESKLDGSCRSADDSLPPAPDSEISNSAINVHGNSEHQSRGAQPTFVFSAKTSVELINQASVGGGPVNLGSFGPFNDLIDKGCFGPFSTRLPNVVIPPADPRLNFSKFSGRNFDGSFIKRRKIHRVLTIDHCDQPSDNSISSVRDVSPSVNAGSVNPPPSFPPIPHIPPFDLNSSPCRSNSFEATNPQIPLPSHTSPIQEIERVAEIGQIIGFNITKDDEILKEVMGETGGHLNS
ncbi:hypothetical protein L1887_11698 [Cichorium endivia]|nr:hypothetical protein L1887_11698 [Cichorium endivia]